MKLILYQSKHFINFNYWYKQLFIINFLSNWKLQVLCVIPLPVTESHHALIDKFYIFRDNHSLQIAMKTRYQENKDFS